MSRVTQRPPPYIVNLPTVSIGKAEVAERNQYALRNKVVGVRPRLQETVDSKGPVPLPRLQTLALPGERLIFLREACILELQSCTGFFSNTAHGHHLAIPFTQVGTATL